MSKGKNLFFGFIAIILSWTLFKQFDFEGLKFKHTGLAMVYIIVLVLSVYFIVKGNKKHEG